MVEIFTPETGRVRLSGDGFMALTYNGLEIYVRGDGVIIAPPKFSIVTGLWPNPEFPDIQGLKPDDKAYQLTLVKLVGKNGTSIRLHPEKPV